MANVGNFECPKCGSANLRRSRRANDGEWLLKALGIKAYRCNGCFWRGYARQRRDGSFSLLTLNEETVKKRTALTWRLVILAIVTVVAILVLVKMV